MVGLTSAHTYKIVESDVNYAELLRLITDGGDTKYLKMDVNVRAINKINKLLADKREHHMGYDGNTVTAEDVDLDVPKEKDEKFPNMLPKHEKICSGKLGDINFTAMRIELKPYPNLSKSPPYRARPKTQSCKEPRSARNLPPAS